MRKFFTIILIAFIVSILIPSVGFAQKEGTLKECKKWFSLAMKDYKKDFFNFSSKYCKLPFLKGSGGDAFYSYNTLYEEEMLTQSLKDIFGCLNKKSSQKKLIFKEIIASEESLSYLSNSYEYNERDEKGNKVNPNAKPAYDGLIKFGEKVFTISYNCGPKHPSYGVAIVYDLYVIFDHSTQSYRFWASTSGL